MYSKYLQVSERPFRRSKLILDEYEIVDMLGKGSYGLTYLVKDRRGHPYVLKQLRKYKQYDESGRLSFQREAEIMKRLNNDAFPSCYRQFEYLNKCFILMEFKKGLTFEQLIFDKKCKFSEKETFTHLIHILKIVNEIHQQDIVHRDLRIPNILFNDGHYYIIDFGLAKFLKDNREDEHNDGNIAKRLFREVAFKSDFYALGHFVLFLLYSSYTPVSRKNKTWEEELSISTEGKSILRKMLQLSKPYETIEPLISDVQDCLQNLVD
ncbi:serine/threonine protein kinase [Metabacillus malikii]|uniref:Serine/threonine-protein kinase n=1 Tax=Metabacillus malikii TaxID=1504265 RepID=A0ABT9Z9F7_9BACI|nr:protein kinase [Metabacillus malikii]MDQ0228894.1 serine/threonine-protein kinase [Metabacillus malikii]